MPCIRPSTRVYTIYCTHSAIVMFFFIGYSWLSQEMHAVILDVSFCYVRSVTPLSHAINSHMDLYIYTHTLLLQSTSHNSFAEFH